MLKEINREKIASGKHLELVKINLEGDRVYEVCSRVGNKNAVAGLLRHTENRSYILIEQYRYPVKQKVLELVAGLIDKDGLSKEQIMKEEVIEETGYNIIQNINYICETSGSAGKSSETTTLFDVEITGEKDKQNLGEMEDIKVIEVPYNDFDSFIKSKMKEGLIIDPKVCMAVYMTLEKTKKLL
ncbi:MAG: NUDIX hydrolase [Candidatus Gracilibacteria bacterium]|nr:NUDIX hydrolase [Candidatus Gracilibacteria bacterium]